MDRPPWKRWKIVRSLGGGGQGATSLVEDTLRPELGPQFVLKLLNNQRDPERRKRMFREVSALRTLGHPGIPKFVDSNADRFENDEPLFLVNEFISGPTADESISNQILDLNAAIKMVLRLLEITEYCHQRDIVHRDIKPENAIFRDRNSADPVLLDFGLSFNKANEETSITESNQEIGNRFLWLPELRHIGANKRDARSDITSCCGILFFALTQQRPVGLVDHDGRKPHQRERARSMLQTLDERRRAILNNIFDIGFESLIDRRWQTVQGLRARLMDLESIDNVADGASENLELLLAQLRTSQSYNSQAQLVEVLRTVSRVLIDAHRRFHARVASEFDNTSSGHHIDVSKLTFSYTMGFVNRNRKLGVYPKFEAVITGSELVVTVAEENDGSFFAELIRIPAEAMNHWGTLAVRAHDYWTAGIARIVKQISQDG